MKKIGLLFLAGVLLLISLPLWPGEKRLLIIDDDNGMDKKGCLKDQKQKPTQPWLPVCDPDGGLELVYLLRDPEVEVLGITCLMGCSSLRVCIEADKKLLKLIGREDIPVLAGAESAKDLGKPTPASQFIIEQIMSHPGKVEILASGPLTNIATAMMLEPRIVENWKELHFATGEFHGRLGRKSDARFWEWTGYQDLNINVDPVATGYVLEKGGAFKIYPNEVMDDVFLSFSEWRRLKHSGSELGTHLARESAIMVLVGSSLGRILGLEGMPLHGLIAGALALHPEWFANETIESGVKMIETKKNGYGFELSSDPSARAHLIYLDFKNIELFKKQYLERFQ